MNDTSWPVRALLAGLIVLSIYLFWQRFGKVLGRIRRSRPTPDFEVRPVGWRVALAPARLVDETGRVIAVEGQQLRLGGGHGEEVHVAGCGDPAVGTFSVQESAYELAQSAGSG